MRKRRILENTKERGKSDKMKKQKRNNINSISSDNSGTFDISGSNFKLGIR